jgi:hypothetical protein
MVVFLAARWGGKNSLELNAGIVLLGAVAFGPLVHRVTRAWISSLHRGSPESSATVRMGLTEKGDAKCPRNWDLQDTTLVN